MKADSGFQDNYSVVVASGTWICSIHTPCTVVTEVSSTRQPADHSSQYVWASVTCQRKGIGNINQWALFFQKKNCLKSLQLTYMHWGNTINHIKTVDLQQFSINATEKQVKSKIDGWIFFYLRMKMPWRGSWKCVGVWSC